MLCNYRANSDKIIRHQRRTLCCKSFDLARSRRRPRSREIILEPLLEPMQGFCNTEHMHFTRFEEEGDRSINTEN